MIHYLSKRKAPTPNGLLINFTKYKAQMISLVNFYQTFKEEIILITYNLFQKIETESTFSSSFYEVSTTLILKAGKGIIRKKNYKPKSI